jgi:hypothetical protein
MAKSIEDLSTKFLLTFEESSRYFGIGENKLRNMASYGDTPDWVVHNGKRMLIKRVLFEKYLLNAETI